MVSLHHRDCLYDNRTGIMLALRNPAWPLVTPVEGLALPREIMINGRNGHQIFHHHLRHYDMPENQSKVLFDAYVSTDVRTRSSDDRARSTYRLELYVLMDQLNKRWKELRDAKSDRHIDSSHATGRAITHHANYRSARST